MEKLNLEENNLEEITLSETSETNESFESLQERIEVLQGVVDEFDSSVDRAMTDFQQTSRILFSDEKGFNDDMQLKSLTNIVSKIATFEGHLSAMVKLFETKDGADGLNILLSSVRNFKEQLSVAPDIRYSSEAQIEKYSGKENIPAEKSLDTFEHTQELITSLRGEINGIKSVLRFMNPTKIIK